MFILIDKLNKKCYPGDDLGIIASESGKSVNTLRSWSRKSDWYENSEFLLIKEQRLKGRRGGINIGNEKYFNK
jgi:hypothetical protein